MNPQTVSEEMIAVIKKTHKYSTKPWISKFGVQYIGYGTQNTKLEKVGRDKAEQLLRKELLKISKSLRKLLGDKQIPQHHFDVFCHIAYDHSFKALRISKLLIDYINQDGNLKSLETSHIMTWSKIKGDVSVALLYRREQDLNIFKYRQYKSEKK